jgi:hypothetical protein
MLLMMGIRMICYAPIMGIGGVIMALNKSSSMGWIIATASWSSVSGRDYYEIWRYDAVKTFFFFFCH